MCGICGYIGKKDAVPVIMQGLRKLEYRGYDSAGLVVLDGGKINIKKCIGKIADLENLLSKSDPVNGSIGMGHTRWATHGKPSDINSHPHPDCSGKIVVIHNGIIENYDFLKDKLEKNGHKFRSETDTEVIAHLIEDIYKQNKNFEEAVIAALNKLEGSYAVAVMHEDHHDKIIVAKKNSPLVIGFGDKENFFASDVLAFLNFTKKVVYLSDEEVAVLSQNDIKFFNLQNKKITKSIKSINWDPTEAEKGSYAHYMLKEIFEQSQAIQNTIQGRISRNQDEVFFDNLNFTPAELKQFNRIVIIGCGTSWHSGLIGEYFIEDFAKLPIEVEYAAEFRYRNPVIDAKTLVIAISQSGETADTIAAIDEAQERNAKVIAVCNVIDSTIAREADGVIYTFAGPEIGVASTKAFTTQVIILYLFAIYLGRIREAIPKDEVIKLIDELRKLPSKIQEVLNDGVVDEVKRIANRFKNRNNFLYLGRGVGFPIALEGALKLKEISYIHAEGYPAAEMKHGPIALIDENMPTIVLSFKGRRYEKVVGNIMEVKSRKGIVIAIASEGNKDIAKRVDEVIYIPKASEYLSPILAVIPLQLLAYYIAVSKGCSVDQPRNLAKSVTVE